MGSKIKKKVRLKRVGDELKRGKEESKVQERVGDELQRGKESKMKEWKIN